LTEKKGWKVFSSLFFLFSFSWNQ